MRCAFSMRYSRQLTLELLSDESHPRLPHGTLLLGQATKLVRTEAAVSIQVR